MSSELLLNLKEFTESGCSTCEVCKYHDIDNCPHLGVVREAILLLERQGKLLKERSDGICELRRNWNAAETKICSMCGKFLPGETDTHKGDVVFATDGNGVVCGTRTCGELIAYPRCGKFAPWISVEDRRPEHDGRYLCNVKSFAFRGSYYQTILRYERGEFMEGNIYTDDVTHWMELPDEPEEVSHEAGV